VASKWLDAAQQVAETTTAKMILRRIWLLFEEGEYQEAIHLSANWFAAAQDTLREGQLHVWRMLTYLCETYSGSYSPPHLKRRFQGLELEFIETHPRLRGSWWVLTLAASQADWSTQHWETVLDTAAEQLAHMDGKLLSQWEVSMILRAAARMPRPTRQQRLMRHSHQWRLILLAHLHGDLSRSRVHLVSAWRLPEGLLLATSDEVIRLRAPEAGEQLQRLVILANRWLQHGYKESDALKRLGAQLFPRPLPGSEPVYVASDGLLDEAPLMAAFEAAWLGNPIPPIRVLVGPRERVLDPRIHHREVIAFLDPLGDLPGARAEAELADEAHVGEAASWATLQQLDPRGLLLLSLHTRLSEWGRELVFADQAIPAERLGEIDLSGCTIVINGCSGALESPAVGATEGFARTLRETSGAKAVICFSWPIPDGLARKSTEIMVEKWKTAETVGRFFASWIHKMRKDKFPASFWGAARLY